MENQGVCISLACSPSSSDPLVDSYRPKVEAPDDGVIPQAVTPLSLTPAGSGKLGRHVLMRAGGTSCTEGQIRNGSVSDLRMSKSAIIPRGSNQHLFAYGDESLYGLRTWRLPSFQTFTDLSPHRQPILDLRFAESSTGERYLGCLSAEKLQVFSITEAVIEFIFLLVKLEHIFVYGSCACEHANILLTSNRLRYALYSSC
jgi:E3 ubiquitin-protein ligase RFWD3